MIVSITVALVALNIACTLALYRAVLTWRSIAEKLGHPQRGKCGKCGVRLIDHDSQFFRDHVYDFTGWRLPQYEWISKGRQEALEDVIRRIRTQFRAAKCEHNEGLEEAIELCQQFMAPADLKLHQARGSK